jgi:hypothetical protein
MSQSAGAPDAPALVVRLSVPAGGTYRRVVKELAAKVAGYLGIAEQDAGRVGVALDGLAAKVAPENGDEDKDITFEFRQSDRELLIHARCAGRSSEARHQLPS